MTAPLTKGTTISVRFSAVVDGDTIRVYLPGNPKAESIRLLNIDTEESYSFSSKPKTPWGLKAKSFAYAFFKGTENVDLEFPGTESVDAALEKHRGLFGRVLAYVYKDGIDFQHIMIRKGYTPYFNKYGNATFASHHARYVTAERQAQVEAIGVWDQVGVNGYVARDYPSLKAWWDLRASRIDQYRRLKATDKTVYNTRLDYEKLYELAQKGATATVFTEASYVRRATGSVGLVDIGSKERPFGLKVPDMDCDAGRSVLALLRSRYVGSASRPTAGYCYATGRLEMFSGSPHMEILNPAAVTDSLATRAEVTGPLPPMPPREENTAEDAVMTPVPDEALPQSEEPVQAQGVDLVIAACLPNPSGTDRGNETVTLRNQGMTDADLDGWILRDRVGQTEPLSGRISASADLVVHLKPGGVRLNNLGDDVMLFNREGFLVNSVSYGESDAAAGRTVEFV